MKRSDTKRSAMIVSPGSFLASLSFSDLQVLRAHVRRTHMAGWKPEFRTDRECDRIIEAIGPRVAERCIKEAVDRKWSDFKRSA